MLFQSLKPVFGFIQEKYMIGKGQKFQYGGFDIGLFTTPPATQQTGKPGPTTEV